MDTSTQRKIFHAQVQNVRALESARKQVRRGLNTALRRKDQSAERSHTLVLALLYCAWLEAFFSKLLHTPDGLALDEIEQVKGHQRRDISAAWDKCVDLALSRVPSRGRSSYLPNIGMRLHRLIDEFVRKPSQLRNKIAHGQWVEALNRRNDATNDEISHELADLDIVKIDRWTLAVSRLAAVIEALIESPGRAFHRDYPGEMARLEDELESTKTWTRESRVEKLAKKPIRNGKHNVPSRS